MWNLFCVRIARCVCRTTSVLSFCLAGVACQSSRVVFCPAVRFHHSMNGNNPPLQRNFLFRRFATLLVLALFAVASRAQILPPLTKAFVPNKPLAAAPSLFVREFQFEGNHALSAAQLSEVT